MSSARPSCLLSDRLDREWDALRRRTRAVERARSWGVTDVVFTDLDELIALAGYRTARSTAANTVLGRLVEIAHHDELASRVVLQRLLPGLLAIVRRRRPYDGSGGAFEELLAAAWLAIRVYHPARRPDHIAANLVRDAGYAAFTAPARRRSATEVVIDPSTLEDRPAPTITSAADELAELLALGRAAGVTGADLDLLRHLVRAGSPTLVATECKVTVRTVRNRRDRVTARLRQLALAA